VEHFEKRHPEEWNARCVRNNKAWEESKEE
jgi:hypothetical protein